MHHDDRWWVPGNRWDLVAAARRPARSISVVIPYFEQPASLERMYAALLSATRADLQVVVVDDGSDQPPPHPPDELAGRVRMLHQPDCGCRPGAARNLGAADSDGDVLVFLDADTLPEPATVDALAAWPATVADALVVGARRHADLDGWSGDAVHAWFQGHRAPPVARPDPTWLADGYRATDDLLAADERSYRYVISGVMACDRVLFEDLGGFAADRDEYGGEDWELADRAWRSGAVLVHDPAAVTWHDEPDWADRGVPQEEKNAESLWLSTRLIDPCARGRGLIGAVPRWLVIVDLPAGLPAAVWVITVDELLAELPDAHVVVGPQAPERARDHLSSDPRVVAGRSAVPAATITVVQPIALAQPGVVAAAAERFVQADLGALELCDEGGVVARLDSPRRAGRARRASARGAPWRHASASFATDRWTAPGIDRLAPTVDVAAHLATRRHRSGPFGPGGGGERPRRSRR